MDLNNIDTILYLDNKAINEEDIRYYAKSSPTRMDTFGKGSTNYIDPSLYSMFSFGNILRLQLNDIGRGFSAEVTDFKRWVVIKINYHNTITGRTSSKTFLVVFQKDGDGIVLSTHNKWRSISGVTLAVSYIRSASNILKNDTNNKI